MRKLLADIVSLTDTLNNLYVADFFDVLIIAILIYFVIFLFKQTRSFYVATGIGIIIVLFILVRAFNLFLTSLVFRAFFSVFFIAIVIIFQEELRRFFEYIARWSTRQMKRRGEITASSTINEIINAVKQLSRNKMGALIVIKGRDSLANYISGSRKLDGIITEEILLSIFDTGSPGHDGAVTITHNRIESFGGHLPLSHDFDQIGKRGTRHAAALGLVEATDSFVIVVSEESGAVSYALRGELKTLQEAGDLTTTLNNFLREKHPADAYSPLENLVKRNSLEKLLSVLMATILWFFVSFQATTIQRDYTVPVTYVNTGDSILIEETNPKEVIITLTARGAAAFDLLNPKTLVVAIDAAKLTVGAQKITITEDAINHVRGFAIVNIEPKEITVKIKAVKLADVAISPTIIGKVRPGFEVVGVIVTPATVKALVPESFSPETKIPTEPIDIMGLQTSEIRTVKLSIPQEIRLKERPDINVEVKIEVRRK